MNQQTNLIVIAAITTAAVGHSVIESAFTRHQARQKRKQIKHEEELDLIAIRRAGVRMKAALADGEYDHLSVEEMILMINQNIEFERIAIRLEN